MWHLRKREVVEKASPDPELGRLAEVLSSDPDWRARQQAAETLGRIGDLSVLDALRRADTDARAEVREAASRASGDIGLRLVDEATRGRSKRKERTAEETADAYWKSLGG